MTDNGRTCRRRGRGGHLGRRSGVMIVIVVVAAAAAAGVHVVGGGCGVAVDGVVGVVVDQAAADAAQVGTDVKGVRLPGTFIVPMKTVPT